LSLEFWYCAVILIAAGLAIPLMLALERLGPRLGMVDRPRVGEVQQRPLPRTGGYGVFAAFWLAVLAGFAVAPDAVERLPADTHRLLGVALGSLMLIPLAVADDRRRLGPWPQLAGQIAAASVAVVFGVRMEEIATPAGVVAIPDPVGSLLAVVWIVAMINAINLIDTMDGLAAGVSAIAGFVLFLRSAWFGQASIAILPAALCGACLGFLTRNWHPSRIILGSSGALFLGYMLGVVTLIGGAKIGTAFLVLAVPILDVAWVIYRRVSRGRSPFRGGDAEHLPHRLRALGMSDPAIAISLYAVCAAVGLAILLMHSTMPGPEKAVLAAGVVFGVLGALMTIARREDAKRRHANATEAAGNAR